MANKGTYVKPAPIGSTVITTDDVLAQGNDFAYLKMGGMLKVAGTQVDGDLLVGAGAAYVPPAALSFSTDLASTKSVAAGATLTLSVVAAGGVAPYVYKWFKGNSEISGATSATYTKAAVAGDAGVYTCQIWDSAGKTLVSTACTVTVTE